MPIQAKSVPGTVPIKLIAPRLVHFAGVDWLPGEIRSVTEDQADTIRSKPAWWAPDGGKLFGPPDFRLPGEDGTGPEKPGLLAYSIEASLSRIRKAKDMVTLETWGRYEETQKEPRTDVIKALEKRWNDLRLEEEKRHEAALKAERERIAKEQEEAGKGKGNPPPPPPPPPAK